MERGRITAEQLGRYLIHPDGGGKEEMKHPILYVPRLLEEFKSYHYREDNIMPTETYQSATARDVDQLRNTVSREEPPVRCNDINIRKVANGFILDIGCKTLVAKTWAEASKGIGEYYEDPVKAEKKYCSK